MDEFQNKLIAKEEVFQTGFFASIPKFNKQNSAFILTGGISDDIVVNEFTTAKEIRRGKYTKLVEISTKPYLKEINFNSQSRESAYSFEVYVKAVIQVNNAITFFQNRNIDVDAYFDNLFSLDVRKITRKYSILNFAGMDEELTQKLSSYNTIDEAIGFSYQISVVYADPEKDAREYVQRLSKQQLDAGLRSNARELVETYSSNYEDAIMAEVVEGKITEAKAILILDEYRKSKFKDNVNQLEELREKGMITDREIKSYVAPVLEQVGAKKQIESKNEQYDMNNNRMKDFYPEEE